MAKLKVTCKHGCKMNECGWCKLLVKENPKTRLTAAAAQCSHEDSEIFSAPNKKGSECKAKCLNCDSILFGVRRGPGDIEWLYERPVRKNPAVKATDAEGIVRRRGDAHRLARYMRAEAELERLAPVKARIHEIYAHLKGIKEALSVGVRGITRHDDLEGAERLFESIEKKAMEGRDRLSRIISLKNEGLDRPSRMNENSDDSLMCYYCNQYFRDPKVSVGILRLTKEERKLLSAALRASPSILAYGPYPDEDTLDYYSLADARRVLRKALKGMMGKYRPRIEGILKKIEKASAA